MTETKSGTIFGKNEKYNRIERVTDKQGRVLGFKILSPSERKEVEAMTPGLDGSTMSKVRYKDDDNGIEREQDIEVPKRADFYLAASLREADGRPMLFPKNRMELNAVLDALDDDGLSAALEAYGKLQPPSNEENKPPLDVIEQAKN